MEPPGALTRGTRAVTRLLGKAFGYGLEADIRDAYVFLMNNFENGDYVFLFGFSRGAYTARAVASLLHMYGLIAKGNEPLVPYAIRMLMAINNLERTRDDRADQEESYFRLARDFKDTFSTRDCKPRFVGLWDTVSSIGWYENPLRFPFSADNPDIEIGRHAIAIDERRAFFRTNLWMPRNPPPQSGPKDLKQVWFPGVHDDVGGGYPEPESGLSKLALEWMLKEAISAGLLVDPAQMSRVLGRSGGGYAPPDTNAIMHESLEPSGGSRSCCGSGTSIGTRGDGSAGRTLVAGVPSHRNLSSTNPLTREGATTRTVCRRMEYPRRDPHVPELYQPVQFVIPAERGEGRNP